MLTVGIILFLLGILLGFSSITGNEILMAGEGKDFQGARRIAENVFASAVVLFFAGAIIIAIEPML